MEIAVPLEAIKGRGAASYVPHRFESLARDAFDDGWGGLDGADAAPPPRTEVILEDAKSVISRNTSPDIHFEQSINSYRGCEHGCVYCYARPSHSYLGLSPGLDFETKIIAKRNVVEVLQRELAARSYVPRALAVGVNTDCYQPIERDLQLTRGVLQTLHDTHHGLALITKSSLVERDIDLLAPLAQQGLAAVYITVTTLDAKLARILEPRAAAPYRRLETIRRLAQAGIPVGVSVAPQIPFINDDMEQVLQAAWDAGARRAFYVVMRLPHELNEIFQAWLQLHYPDRADRVMARIRDMHGIRDDARDLGKSYESNFATRMKGTGPWAELIRQRFDKATRRMGYQRDRYALDYSAFRPPSLGGQGCLF